MRRGVALALFVACFPSLVGASEAFLEPEAAVARVLELSAARLALMPAVAAAKWRTQAAIADPAREVAVIEQAVARGGAVGLDPAGVRALFALEIGLARESEQRLEDRWRTSGFDELAPAVDLSRELRPRLDALTAELVTALYLARPALEEEGFASRHAALAAAILSAPAWSAEARGELLEALGRIRRTPVPALERIAASGVLVVGTTGDYAPFSIESQGRLGGADIELAKAVAAGLGVHAVFVRTQWATLLDDLAAGRFDLAAGGISITPERAARAAFSSAYASGGKTVLARCADARRYRSLAAVDRPGVRVVVNPGGTNQQFVATRIHRANVRVHADNRSIFDELRARRADVMITDDVEVELVTRRYPELCRALPGTLTRAEKALLLPQDEAFVERVDAVLRPLIAAGRPGALRRAYLRGVTVDSSPPAS
jgi:cyclohexadienyl dehydratase